MTRYPTFSDNLFSTIVTIWAIVSYSCTPLAYTHICKVMASQGFTINPVLYRIIPWGHFVFFFNTRSVLNRSAQRCSILFLGMEFLLGVPARVDPMKCHIVLNHVGNVISLSVRWEAIKHVIAPIFVWICVDKGNWKKEKI